MIKHPLRPALKMLIYAMLPVAIKQPKYIYYVQIVYTMLLMHWATKPISPTTVIVQNGYLLPHILVSYPPIFTKFPFTFSAYFFDQPMPMGMIISSVKVDWKGGKGGA